jgi:hypothetical protein
MVGLRFQTLLDVGPQGLVPFAGIMTGPTLAYSRFGSEAPPQEITTQAWAGTVGGTLRLSSHWGLTAEYRIVFVRGPVGGLAGQTFGSFNGGGNWFSVGVTYLWPPEPKNTLSPF